MAAPDRTSFGTPAGRLMGVVLGVVLAAIVLELALRVAACLVPGSRAGDQGECLVLCQGDSNVYGLNLPAEASFPAQLEAELARRGVERSRVVNRGIPGKATWTVRDELEQDLRAFSPRAVVILAGINSRWSVRPDGRGSRLLDRLRVVRLVRLLRAGLDPRRAVRHDEVPELAVGEAPSSLPLGEGRYEVAIRDRGGGVQTLVVENGQPPHASYVAWITQDLACSVELVREGGAIPVLLMYPVDHSPFDGCEIFKEVNDAIAAASMLSNPRLIDTRATFAEAAALAGWDRLLLDDLHPSALGCSVIARLVLEALGETGVVALDRAVDPLEEVRRVVPPAGSE